MNEDIKYLKTLVLEGGFDAESKEHVESLERRFREFLMAEKLLEHPIIEEYISYLTQETIRCSTLLSQDKSLTELERLHLFDKREMCERFIQVFDQKEKHSLEEEIKDLINVAKNS